jgi:hypothetical protein
MKKGNRRKATRSLGMIFSLSSAKSGFSRLTGGFGGGFISFKKSKKTSFSMFAHDLFESPLTPPPWGEGKGEGHELKRT